ncbi:MAG: ATP synthase subunit I [Desulfatiglandales bacterium]|jgi:hypothetical protein|nr:ATP synthase subunit I [Desulfatiglandales bacterium]
MDWDRVYRDLRKRNWVILFVLSSVSYFLMTPSITLGIILGGLIIITNFKVFQYTIRCAFSPEGSMTTRKMPIIMKYYFRLLALGAIIFFLITMARVDPVGLAIGLSTVVFSIVSFGIKKARKGTAGEAV